MSFHDKTFHQSSNAIISNNKNRLILTNEVPPGKALEIEQY
jgi:hypothetical protein